MSRFKDLTGQKFGKLLVLERTGISKNRRLLWKCQCDCGNIHIANSGDLISGNTCSCGCIHKEQMREYNRKVKKAYNEYDLSGEYGIGYTQNGGLFYFDLDDFDKIKDYCWYIDSRGYVQARNFNQSKNEYPEHIRQHRLIMSLGSYNAKDIIDHKNGNFADNRKSNLRCANHIKNGQNTKGKQGRIKGVSWHKLTQSWMAYITVNKKRMYLGIYKQYKDAVKARRKAEEKYFGEWSVYNSRPEYMEDK